MVTSRCTEDEVCHGTPLCHGSGSMWKIGYRWLHCNRWHHVWFHYIGNMTESIHIQLSTIIHNYPQLSTIIHNYPQLSTIIPIYWQEMSDFHHGATIAQLLTWWFEASQQPDFEWGNSVAMESLDVWFRCSWNLSSGHKYVVSVVIERYRI